MGASNVRCQWLVLSACLAGPLLPACAAAADRPVVHPGWTVQHWDVENGLPVNSINAMVRDARGFLWLATMDGLVRFDGVEFKVFDPLNSPGLAGSRLMVLERDGEDALWTATEDMRLVRYSAGTFRSFGPGDGLPHDAVTALSVTETRVWVGTQRGVARWNGHRFESLPDSRWHESTSAILDSEDGTIWLGSESGRLLRLTPDGSSQSAIVPGRVWHIVPHAADGVWVAHNAGLSRWNGTELVAEAAVDFGVQRLAPAGRALYLASPKHLHRWEADRLSQPTPVTPGSGRERLAKVEPSGAWLNAAAGLMRDGELVLSPRFPITDWLPDAGGAVLVATAGDGLYRVAPNAFERPAGPASLREASTYPIVAAPDSAIWIGTNGQGLYRLMPDETEARRVAPETAPGIVLSLLPEDGKNAWIGGEGLWRLDAGVAHRRGIPNELGTATVRSLFRDGLGRLWAGTDDRGVWRLEHGSWRQLELPAALGWVRVRVMAERDGYLWLGTNGFGLLRFHESHGFETLADGESGRLIRALDFDAQGRLLIGTEGRGLCRLDRPDQALRPGAMRCLNRHDGLPHDGVHQLVRGAGDAFWMSTNRGIFSIGQADLDAAFNGGHLAARILTGADGMPDSETNGGVQSAGTVDARGRLWFPTMRGPVALDTRRLPESPPPPMAVIEHLTTASGTLHPGRSTLNLPVGERNLRLGFTAPDLASGAAVRFETRLLGLEEDWQPIGNRREVDFTNLAHGTYRFEVRARAGQRPAGPATGLDMTIPPLLHETPAFRLASVLMLLVLAWLVWGWRMRRMRQVQLRLEYEVEQRTRELSAATEDARRARDQIARQAQRLESLDEEKREFFANISHEMRTPLTLLLGPLEQGQSDPGSMLKQWPLMQRNARRLNRLVEQILDLQRIEGGTLAIEPELRDLAGWARSVADLFRPLAVSRGIDLQMSGPPAGVLAWFDPAQMEKVLGNLLSNAIKHCRSGDRVDVGVARHGETAWLQVGDTGPGIAAEHLPRLFDRFYRAVPSGFQIEGTGIGLALARELALLHGGDLSVDSALGEGARFTLQWPARAMDGHLLSPALVAAPRTPDPPSEFQIETEVATDDAPRILVVDDNADLRRWLCQSLGARYAIDEAEDGESALERMRSCLPDVVVSDWMMPGMDGIALLERIGANADYNSVPVIVLSARAEVDDRIRGLDAGAVAYLRKPFRIEELQSQIDSLLAMRLRLRRASEGAPTPMPVRNNESAWLRRLREVIDANLHDPDFGVEALAIRSAIGRTGLFRRLKEEAASSPSELLREARLQRGAALLDERAGSVSEIAYAVGFNSIDGFTRAFVARFRQRPSERLARAHQQRTDHGETLGCQPNGHAPDIEPRARREAG